MNVNKLAVTAAEALQTALGIATDVDASACEPVHLLKALLASGERNLDSIIEKIGATPAPSSTRPTTPSPRSPRSPARACRRWGSRAAS